MPDIDGRPLTPPPPPDTIRMPHAPVATYADPEVGLRLELVASSAPAAG